MIFYRLIHVVQSRALYGFFPVALTSLFAGNNSKRREASQWKKQTVLWAKSLVHLKVQ